MVWPAAGWSRPVAFAASAGAAAALSPFSASNRSTALNSRSRAAIAGSLASNSSNSARAESSISPVRYAESSRSCSGEIMPSSSVRIGGCSRPDGGGLDLKSRRWCSASGPARRRSPLRRSAPNSAAGSRSARSSAPFAGNARALRAAVPRPRRHQMPRPAHRALPPKAAAGRVGFSASAESACLLPISRASDRKLCTVSYDCHWRARTSIVS